MDQKNFIQSLLPVLLLASATIAGWLVKPIYFSSERRGSEVSNSVSTRGQQTLDARLWKDPFEARRAIKPEGAEKENRKAFERLNTLAATLCALEDEKPVRKAALLVALTPGGRSGDDAERRRCDRHAVLAGLGMAGYVPADEAHLGAFAMPWGRPGSSGQSKTDLSDGASWDNPIEGSFEWLEPANTRARTTYQRVLVLWLPEEEFLTQPLARLGQLALRLGRGKASEFKMMLLGPRTSGGLVALCEEAEAATKPGASTTFRPLPREEFPPELPGYSGEKFTLKQVLDGLEIYSATATVTDELLPPYEVSATAKLRGRPYLTAQLSGSGIRFFNYASDDAALSKALVKELALRGVVGGTGTDLKNAVLLVSEWHTDYGRALPLTVAAQWEVANRERADLQNQCRTKINFGDILRAIQTNPQRNLPPGLYKETYMSGVDGDAMSKPKGEGTKERASSASAPGGAADSGKARPDGDSQFDYVQREAVRLDGEFSGRGKSLAVRAVGVMGSDIYDKMALLQALRAKFPEAIFFTTDLHAWMLAPEMQEWTRNLVVASGRELQSARVMGSVHIPPFRDSYQAAIYDAVVAALCGPDPDARDLPTARLFEIGRTEAVKLSDPCRSPQTSGAAVLGGVGLVLLALSAFAVAGWHLWRPRRQLQFPDPAEGAACQRADSSEVGESRRLRGEKTSVWVLLTFLLSGAFYLCYLAHGKGYGEVGVLAVFLIGMAGTLTVWFSRRGERKENTPPWTERFRSFIVPGWVAVSAILLVLAGALLAGRGAFSVEPFRWAEGVSLWPVEMVRIGAGLLGIYWIIQTRVNLRACYADLTEDFKLYPGQTRAGYKQGDDPKDYVNEAHKIVAWLAWKIYGDRIDVTDTPSKWTIWGRGCIRHHTVWLVSTAVLMGFWLYFTFGQDRPLRVPYRGEFALWVDRGVVLAITLIYTLLCVQVFDVIRHTRLLIRRVAGYPTAWPDGLLVDKKLKHNEPDVDGWLDVKFIARLTETIGRLVLLPFVLLFILLAALNGYFDRWSLNRPDIAVLCTVNALLPLICGFLLCRAAENARAEAENRLTEALVGFREDAASPSQLGAKDRGERLKVMLDEVRSCRDGAFRPFYEQPYVIALLIPLGGSGSIELIQRLMSS